MTTIAGKSVVVVGGSRGLGLGVARAARDAGAMVTVVARDLSPTGDDLAAQDGIDAAGHGMDAAGDGIDGARDGIDAARDGIDGEQGDAVDESFAEKVLATRRPDLLVITAGAAPEMGPLTAQTWETFSTNWHADVRIAFTWLRAVLRLPLAPGSRVVVFGSAAELRGSPLSGGYAGAKATVRIITGYAAGEASGSGLGTTVGETGIQAYAKSSGRTPEEFRAALLAPPTPASVGAAIVGLAAVPDVEVASAYLLDATGQRTL